jgi:enediyne biosynthesis protein E4
VAVAADGQPRAGMGIDAGDYDRDGRFDIAITNLDFQMHSLHRALDRGLFASSAIDSGIGYPTLPFVGFGVVFLDFDNDSQLDLAIANGHILENAPQFRAGATYRQRNLLFRNTTLRRFQEIGRAAGPGFAPAKVSRGLAAADIDNDGDLDLLVTNNNAASNLLLNEGGRGNAVIVRVIGTRGNRSAIGTHLALLTGQRRQMRDVQSGSSYLSQNDLRAHFGLGDAKQSERLEIRWPGGMIETVENLPANHVITIHEGKGIVSRVPFTR